MAFTSEIILTKSNDWIVPAGVYEILRAECWGAGGKASYTGGGGGAYAATYNIPVKPGDVFTVRVGKSDQYDNTTSSFTSQGEVLVLAVGASYKTGGQDVDCIGDLVYSGGNGGSADMREGNPREQRRGGAGGGSGGPGGPGGNGGNATYPTNTAAGGLGGHDSSYPYPMGNGGGWNGAFFAQNYGGGARGNDGVDGSYVYGQQGAVRLLVKNYNSQQLFLAL